MNTFHKDQTCRFCGIGRGAHFHGLVDRPFVEDDGHFSVASIGPLVEGWSLVVPREHCLSLSSLYRTQPFKSFVRQTVERVEAQYGQTLVFEHGANRAGSPTSCGTDHAHLHVVPTSIRLESLALNSDLRPWIRVRAEDICDLTGDSEYLFVCENPLDKEAVGLLHILQSPISQFFRKLIAAHLGEMDVCDYKIHLQLNVAERASQRLAVVG